MKSDISTYLPMIEEAFREAGEIDICIKPNQQIGGWLKYAHSYSCNIWPEEGIISIDENFENEFIQASELMQFSEEFLKAGFKPIGENLRGKDYFFKGKLSLATLEFALYFLKTRNVKVIPAEKNMAQCCKCGVYLPISDMKKTKLGYDCGCDKIIKGIV